MSIVRLSRALQAAVVISCMCSLPACAEPTGAGTNAVSDNAPTKSFSIAGRIYHQASATRFKLPKVLREISGLTLDDAEQLYGHDDERAIVYQIDYQTGRVQKRFGLQDGLKADFEGIAWLNDRLFMTTSTGRLFEFPAGAADSVVPFATYTEGLDCEVEGLTRALDRQALIAACKNRPRGKRALHLYRWQPGDERWPVSPVIQVKRSQFDPLFERLGMQRPDKFQLTAITTTPEGRFLLIAGPQRVLLELSADGTPLAAAQLDANEHRQPEGIAITASGALIIADEGDNKGANKSRGRLTIYRPEPSDAATR